MSLLFHRGKIARAVAGDLAPAAEERLRAHLRGCETCRAHYDRLSRVTEALAAGVSVQATARERARLERALAAAPAPGTSAAVTTVSPSRVRAPWFIAGAVLAPAVALLLWFGRPSSTPHDGQGLPGADVGLRGATGPTNDVPASPVLVMYASRRTGTGGRAPVRLVGELPGSGTVRVSRADYLQFGVRGLAGAALVSVAARGDSGATHVFLPRAGGAAPRAEAGPDAAVVGPSFDLAREPAAGRYAITARFSRPPSGDSGTMDEPVAEVSGFLLIEP